MSTINETQRKYLMKRMEDIKTAKMREIDNSIPFPAAVFPSDASKLDYIKKELERVGLDWEIRYAGYVTTNLDKQWMAEGAERSAKIGEKKKEYNKLHDKTLDSIILGTDAEAINAALQVLTDFN